jgi:hypothetical protein
MSRMFFGAQGLPKAQGVLSRKAATKGNSSCAALLGVSDAEACVFWDETTRAAAAAFLIEPFLIARNRAS